VGTFTGGDGFRNANQVVTLPGRSITFDRTQRKRESIK
jgi:hypothetical protein